MRSSRAALLSVIKLYLVVSTLHYHYTNCYTILALANSVIIIISFKK